jgi:hypothetical protein
MQRVASLVVRFEGYARHEAEIWKHEWFHMSDSDEKDIGEGETCSGGSHEVWPSVESWLASVTDAEGDCERRDLTGRGLTRSN